MVALLLAAMVVVLSGCISSFSPRGGPVAGGTTVTITGMHFLGATAVKFGTTPATRFTVKNSTTITAVTKAHAAGTVNISVTTPTGVFSKGTLTFEVPPTLSTFSPAIGTTFGGTSVTLTGTHFTNTTAVKFGSTTAFRFTVTSPTKVTAITEAHATGTVTVMLSTYGGTATAPSDYQFKDPPPPPIITSFTPQEGAFAGGNTVTITGTNLFGATAVHFATTKAASFTVTSPTTVTAITAAHPDGVGGGGKITVTTAGGTATSRAWFRWLPPPTISLTSRRTAGPLSGATVWIEGTNLTGATAVMFGTTTAASFVKEGKTGITGPVSWAILAYAKPHSAGSVPVRVVTPQGTATATSLYTFVPAPTITNFSPTSGSGGTVVTITGSNFSGPGFTATQVNLDDTVTSFTVTSPTTITAVAEPHSAETAAAVKVTTPGGTATAPTRFKFTGDPWAGQLTPSIGTKNGGTTVAILGPPVGGELTQVTAVQFGTTTAATFHVTSPSRITAVTRPHQVGTTPVWIVDPAGKSFVADFRFIGTVPTITSFSPPVVNAANPGSVRITGSGFTGTLSVAFGTTSATNAASKRSVSPTELMVIPDPHAVGEVHIHVTTSAGSVMSSGEIIFANAPTVTGVTPPSGTKTDGTTVTITGTGFVTGATVEFGGLAATTAVVVSTTFLTAKAPARAPGSTSVSVTTAAGSSGLSAHFTYVTSP